MGHVFSSHPFALLNIACAAAVGCSLASVGLAAGTSSFLNLLFITPTTHIDHAPPHTGPIEQRLYLLQIAKTVQPALYREKMCPTSSEKLATIALYSEILGISQERTIYGSSPLHHEAKRVSAWLKNDQTTINPS